MSVDHICVLRDLTDKPIILEDTVDTLQPVPVLETSRLKPTSYGKCDNTLYERVIKGQQNVFTDSKGAKILPLLTPPKNLLCIGGEFQQMVEDSTQIFILLNQLHWLPIDKGGDCCSQIPLLVGKGHHHLFGFAYIQFQV